MPCMTRRGWILVTSALLACVGAWFGSVQLVRWYALERLKERSIVADIGAVRPGFGRLVLVDVTWTHDSGRARGRFSEVRVDVGFGGVRRLGVSGGEVHLNGSVQQVREAWGGKSKGNSVQPARRERRSFYVEGLDVQWQGVFSDESSVSEVAVRRLFARREEGFIELRFDHAVARARGLEGELSHVLAKADADDFGVLGLQVGSARAVIDIDAVRAHLAERPPGADPMARPRAAAPSADVDEPSRAAPAALGWISLNPGRGQRVRETLQRLAGVVRRRLPPQGALEVSQVAVTVKHGAQSLTIGPGRVSGAQRAGNLGLSFTSGLADDARPFEADAEIPLAGGPVVFRLRAGPVSLAALGIRAGDFGLQEVEQSSLTVDSVITLGEDGIRADFSSSGALERIAIQHERLAPHALTGIDLGWDAKGFAHLDGSHLHVEPSGVRLGRVNGEASLDLLREEKRMAVEADFRIESESCADMLAALPNGAVPLLAGSRMSGDFSWVGAVKLDTDDLANVEATWKMRNRCRFTSYPDEADPRQFRTQFSLNVPGSDGEPMGLTTGPGSRHWTPIQKISPFLEVAVLTTEDGRFWNHRGFDSSAIAGAIRRNLSRGEFSRGASTISMQLAKNLYLERDKYVARKVQEALLTMLLEQELPKPQILELYFNVIEYGPGVYGIRQAAKHYFNSTPGELSLAQCFFLASILPKPKAAHFDETGNLSESRTRLVRTLMKTAQRRGRISAEDLERGLAEVLRFGLPHLESNPYRNPDGSAVNEPFFPGGGADLVDPLP